jgi:hypothetical protein
VIRTNTLGLELWSASYGDIADDGGRSGFQTEDGGYASFGYKYVSGQQLNFYLVKMDDEGTVGIMPVNDGDASLTVFPNPVKTTATVQFPNPDNHTYEFTLTDISGQTVKNIHSVTGSQVVIEKGGLPGGIYFITLRGDKTYRSKIVFN